MISLFLNTSINFLNIAILKDNIVLKEKYVTLNNDLSTITLSILENMLEELKIDRMSINEIVCVNGPGSFTGLRIGVTIAKVYANSLGIDVTEVSSLYALATGIKAKYIVPIIDARRGYVFAGIYNEKYEPILNDCYIELEELNKKVEELDDKAIYVSGDGFNNSIIYKPEINRLFKYLKKKTVNVNEFVPNYLKKTEAEEKLHND